MIIIIISIIISIPPTNSYSDMGIQLSMYVSNKTLTIGNTVQYPLAVWRCCFHALFSQVLQNRNIAYAGWCFPVAKRLFLRLDGRAAEWNSSRGKSVCDNEASMHTQYFLGMKSQRPFLFFADDVPYLWFHKRRPVFFTITTWNV